MEEERQEQEQPKYVPRPKKHLVLAWILAGLVAVGFALQLYWMMHP